MVDIVYLDDEPDLTDIFKLFFESTSHDIQVFNDEKPAIAHCIKKPPNILFVDYRLKTMTGDEVAAQINPQVMTVLVTGDIKVESNFTFDAIIKKPFKLSELIATVEKLSNQLNRMP
ncbi:MAG: response regulator [Gammaproteobacteria bacterium]|nr:response regulator [Gammaproteobacteria bacterium]